MGELAKRRAKILYSTPRIVLYDRGTDTYSVDEELAKCVSATELDMGRVLRQLMKDKIWLGCSVRSIFVEGGVSVVDALLRRPEEVDEVIVTVAPVFVGGVGPASSPFAGGPARLRRVASLAVGDDVVIRGTFAADAPANEAADDRPPKRARTD